MSYCVNCGVELAESEKHCPLCSVEVQNPKMPWQEPVERPYPRYLETLMDRIDRRYFATLAGLILLIPILLTIIFDLLGGDGLSWSAYIVGAMALIFVIGVLPFYFKRRHTVIFISADCLAVLLYLLFIERMNGGQWFVGIGMPITVAASVCVIVLALLFTKKEHASFLVRAASVLIAAGVFVVCVEVILSLNQMRQVELNWSLYAFIPCVILSIVTSVLEQRKNLKEEIRRRLFY